MDLEDNKQLEKLHLYSCQALENRMQRCESLPEVKPWHGFMLGNGRDRAQFREQFPTLVRSRSYESL